MKNFGGMGNMGNMMKQAQKLQAKMAKIQEEVAEKTVDVSVGGGMVSVVVNGKQQVESIKIDPEATGDLDMLQDMILTAVNKGINDSQDLVKNALSGLSAGLPPGLF